MVNSAFPEIPLEAWRPTKNTLHLYCQIVGDDNVPAPAFYSYTAPEPAGLADEPLSPTAGTWQESNGSHMALLMYDDVRTADDPNRMVLDFLESSYQAGAKRADWDINEFSSNAPA
ncbi:MAG: hypothetical protein IT174_00390 [Acidobacteria bacterium]|nr:hypothetical protein [Acidobacteriota bacterium]